MNKIIVNDKNIWYAKDQYELADIFGFTPQYCTQALKEGAPKSTDQGYCTGGWYQWLKNRSKTKEKDKDSTPLKRANLKLRQEKARLAEIERKVMEGVLVDAKSYRENEISRMTELAQEFKSLSKKVSARVANKSAPEAQAIIDIEVKRILKYFENLVLYGRVSDAPAKGKVGRKKKIEKASKKGR